jgi:uncharacterized protein
VFLSASAVGFYGYDTGEAVSAWGGWRGGGCGIVLRPACQVLDEGAAMGGGFLADVVREWEGQAKPIAAKRVRVVYSRFGVVLSRDAGIIAKLLPIFQVRL